SGRDRIALDFRSSTSAAPRIRPPTYESQPIHPNQEVSRRTLRVCGGGLVWIASLSLAMTREMVRLEHILLQDALW
ncbi:MAG: hypothetical protein ACLPSW_25255, partial [Roseiarcus sp.]